MTSVINITTIRKPVTHYAEYHGTYGTAQLLNGSGWLFRKEGERKATLVSYKDVDLLLFGRCDLVAQADAADGDRVLRRSQTLQGAGR
jgi:hypothetical protein